MKMMELTYQEHTEAKFRWPVNCYSEWYDMRLDREEFNDMILKADLHEQIKLTKDNLEHSLCWFICEVKKTKVDGDYLGHTLYETTCSLQSYLKKKGFNWKLVHGNEFVKFKRVLDRVTQERAEMCIGNT